MQLLPTVGSHRCSVAVASSLNLCNTERWQSVSCPDLLVYVFPIRIVVSRHGYQWVAFNEEEVKICVQGFIFIQPR